MHRSARGAKTIFYTQVRLQLFTVKCMYLQNAVLNFYMAKAVWGSGLNAYRLQSECFHSYSI